MQAEAQDNRLLTAAMTAVGQGGFPALDPLLPALREALLRAPAQYPTLEIEGERILVRADEPAEYEALSKAATASLLRRNPAARATAVQAPNVYPDIAVVLASEAMQRQRLPEALAYINRGLALQPHMPGLVRQRAVVLQALGRHAEALAFVDAELASGDMVLMLHRGALLRARGFSLVELERLDEARASYVQSLEAEPGNAVARGQLDYIAGLKAGGSPAAAVFATPAAGPVR